MKKLLLLFIIIVASACHDTQSFENVRKLRIGMSIAEVEECVGEPISFHLIEPGVEKRMYIYDNPGNGCDSNVWVTFDNDTATEIKN